MSNFLKQFLLATTFMVSVLPFAGATPLKVLSASPKGSLSESGRQAITISFNQPVVALSEQSELAGSNCPVILTPAVAGSCRYAGTQTLVFEPEQEWPQATSITVRLNAGFSSRVSGEKLAAPYAFSFTTPRPQVRVVYPYNNEHWVSLTPVLYVGFSQPMNPSLAARQSYLTDGTGRKISLSARLVTPEELEKHFSYLPGVEYALAFTPGEKLNKGITYTLSLLPGLKGAKGSLGLEKLYQSSFVTVPELTVLGVRSEGCLPYMPQIRFSAPVRMRELLASAKITPQHALKKLTDYELDALGYSRVIHPLDTLSPTTRQETLSEFGLSVKEQQKGTAFFATNLSFLDLRPGETVTVTLDKNLQDIYGGRLGKDYTFNVTNNGYCPAVDFSGGFGVLESYLPARLPIEVINTPSIWLQTALFNKETYIPFLAKQKDVRHCKSVPLVNPVFDGNYTFKDTKDRTLKTYFDLTRFHPTAQDSLVFSQLKIQQNGREDCWHSATSNLTDVGITFKTSPENILLWATSLETGEPLANLTVELRDKTNTILWSGSTDMNGFARAPGWTKLDTPAVSWGSPVLYAFVSSAGGDGFISTELDNGLEPWRFNIPYTYSPKQEQEKTFLFTERGIYRPGETVYVKGLVRTWQKEGWHFPVDMKGKLVVSDSTGQEIVNETLTVSAKGSFDTQFVLPSTAHTGDWNISFTPEVKEKEDVVSTYAYFQVESAKPAEFTLALQPEKDHYMVGEKAKFSVVAHYQFGSPLGDSPAKWDVRREMAWFEHENFKQYIFTPDFLRENEYKENGKLVFSTSGRTDDKGAAWIEAPLPTVATPTRLFAQVSVQSPARQDLFARSSVLLHPAAFYLGSKLPEGYAQVNKPVSADIVAVTPQGKRTRAHVTAQIRKEEWHSIRKVGLSGRLEWVSEKEVFELPSQHFEVPEAGYAFSFTPAQSGRYYVTLLSQDQAGHTVQGGFEVMVYGKDGPAWAQRDDDILILKQDKNTYRPGQKARISVQSPYDKALALVTVEREGILDAWTTTLKGGADYIEVPIKDNYLPNVYVSVTLIRGRSAAPVSADGVDLGKPQGKMGYVNLTVAPESKKMQVTVNTDKTHYRPGEEATVKIATQLGRKGVPAEVTLFVVDEGVLALTDYKTPDPFSDFYAKRLLSVFTADNRPYVIGQRNFGEKGENRGGGGSAFAKLGGVDLRSRFSFVPYFQAQVQTDAKGRASVRVKLPDNLTRFRIMAVAAREQEFGAGQTQIKVSKPLMITSNLPKVVHLNDQFLCSAIVYNYEDKKGELTVQAASQGGVELSEGDARKIQVPLGQAKEITWPCRATRMEPAQVIFRVNGKREADGVKTEIIVNPVEQPQTLMLYGATESTKEELLDQPSHLSLLANNHVGTSLASTALLNLKGAISYLMVYPYDCLEQQMSKIQPVISSAELVKDFKLADVADFKKQAQEILNHIPDYQHSSGGFGYWKESRPDPYVTAYVLETAYRARQAGFTVPDRSLQAAVNWLEKCFEKNQMRAFDYANRETETVRAYNVYVLALYGKQTAAAFNVLFARRNTLPFPAVAYLLKGAQAAGRTEFIKQTLAQQLRNQITYTPQRAYFTMSSSMPWLHLTDVSVTALALDALLTAKQPFEDAFKVVSWLLTQLNAQGHWNSTAENAIVLGALQRYYQTVEAQVPDFTAQTEWNGISGLTASFQGRTLEEKNQTLPFDRAYANSTEARVRLSKNGAGTLYYTLWQTYTPQAYLTPAQAGFEVSRRITTLDGVEVRRLQAGQRYYVTLTLRSAAARHFVVAEDFIPAGVEIVNTSLATEAQPAGGENTNSAFGRVERYDDRIAALADYLPAGTHTFTYMISAVSRGTFSYPCAWASLMYDPGLFGRNTTETLIIE